ncbi:MAG: hypothetical protein Q9M76_06750, partial [Candidatus Dojkabacteria bacterium]|nr:hypothetical protein [Candidatus Dojkabacteria bacterium]
MIHTTVSVIKKFDENSLKSISKVIIDLDINKYNISFNFEKILRKLKLTKSEVYLILLFLVSSLANVYLLIN